MNNKIKLIVFDIGGVLIRLADGWEGACDCAGIPYHHFDMSIPQLERCSELETLLNTNSIIFNDYVRRVSALFDGLYSPEDIQDIYQAIIREEYPGIYELVVALEHFGLSTACLSNTCAPHWDDLKNPTLYPTIHALDYTHASHLFGVAKPDPHIFKLFESATNFSADDILFFDDRLENVMVARQCCWRAEQIQSGCSPVEQIYARLAAHGIVLDQ